METGYGSGNLAVTGVPNPVTGLLVVFLKALILGWEELHQAGLA